MADDIHHHYDIALTIFFFDHRPSYTWTVVQSLTSSRHLRLVLFVGSVGPLVLKSVGFVIKRGPSMFPMETRSHPMQ
jgi:hypothetical protein